MSVAVASDPLAAIMGAHAAFAQATAGSAEAWVQTLRAEALDQFQRRGFPTSRLEPWRFTPLAAITRPPWALAPSHSEVSAEFVARYRLPGTRLLVAVNGEYRHDLSDPGELPETCGAGSLRMALAYKPEKLRPHFARLVGVTDQPFESLNLAFFQEGSFLYLAEDHHFAEPFQVLSIAVPGAGDTMLHPRMLIVLESGARAQVVQHFVDFTEGTLLRNGVTEIILGEAASLTHYRVQDELPTTTHLVTQAIELAAGAHYEGLALQLGGGLTRLEQRAWLLGEGAQASLKGLYVADAKRHVETRTTIDHQVPRTRSDQRFKGILRDSAHGVFAGRVIIRPDAQGVEATQENKNLLLSEDAVINTLPQLEIYADDVKASHGATTGALDPTQQFYLESRGLPKPQAEAILALAFAAELLLEIAIPALTQRTLAQLEDLLARGAAIEPGFTELALGQGATR